MMACNSNTMCNPLLQLLLYGAGYYIVSRHPYILWFRTFFYRTRHLILDLTRQITWTSKCLFTLQYCLITLLMARSLGMSTRMLSLITAL